MVEQLDELRYQLNEIDTISRNVDLTVEDAKKKTKQGEMSISEAEKVLQKIYNQLSVNAFTLYYVT